MQYSTLQYSKLLFCRALLTIGVMTLPLAAQVPTANPATVSLSAPAFSTAAVSQIVTLTGAAGQSWRVQAVGGFWLRFLVTPTCPASVNDCTTTTTGSTTITILADPTGLPAYLYSGYLSITHPGGVATVPVTFNVGGGAGASVLTAAPSSLSFAAAPSSSSQSQTLSITGTGSSIYFAATSNVPWLTTSLGGGSTFAPSSVTVTADPSTLSAGTYQGTLTLTPAGSGAATTTVAVTLTVTTTPLLVVSPTSLAFSTSTGLVSAPVLIGVNTGPPVTYTAAVSYPGLAALRWLTTSVTSGQTGQTGTSLILSATGAATLPAGDYSATVTISSPGLAPVFITVTLNTSSSSTPRLVSDVNPIPISVAPSSTGARTFVIGTSTGAIIPYTIARQYTSPQNPAVDWLSFISTALTTPASVTVIANPGSLPSGTYTANLLVSSAQGGFASLTISVTMTVMGTMMGTQTVTYSPSSLSFSYNGSGATTSTQNIQIGLSPSSPSPAASVTAIPDVAGQTWLSAVLLTPIPGSISNGAQVSVSVNAAGLPLGTYTGRVQISTAAVSNSLIQIPIAFTVSSAGGAPIVLLSPNLLTFTSALNGPLTDQSLIVTANTGVAVPFSLSVNVPWITVLNSTGSTPNTATIRVNPVGLATGLYLAAITLNAPGASNNGAIVPVSLSINATSQGGLILSPTSLSFIAQANGTPPAPRNVSISSPSAVLAYTVTSSQNWLQGIASTDNTPGNIAVYVNPAGLAAGIYSGSLRVFSSAFTVNLPVTLEITNGPLLRLSQQSVTFNYQSGLALPSPRTFLVSASTGAGLGATISASTSSGGNWLVATPLIVQTPGAFAVSLVSNIVSTLPPGNYSGIVTITAPGTTTLSSTINVTLNVSAGLLLTMSTAPVNFNAEVNGNSLPAQQRPITSTSGTLTVSASASTNTGSGWLTATVNSGSTPSTLTISASPAGLSAGIYTGSVTVSSGNSGTVSNGANALVIPVTLNVNSLLSLNVDKSELIFSGANLAAPQTIQINSTSGNLSYGVSSSLGNSTANWLTLSTSNGVTPSSLIVQVNPALLSDGTYFATVTITAQTAGSTPLMIPVTLIVNRGVALQVTPTTLSFTQLRGLPPLPIQQTIQVSSQQPFTFTSSVNWLTVTQSGGPSGGTLQVALNSAASSLPAGNYTATITVFDTNSGSSTPVTVTLTVISTSTLLATPNSVNFTGRLGQSNPPAQTVQIASTMAAAPLSFNVTSDVNWLSVTPLAATTPASISISVITAALPPGVPIAVGHLTLVPLTGGQTATITVSFTVSFPAEPAPMISAFANSATYQPGPLSPGMLFTIIGTDLGPSQAVSGTVANGRFATSLAGVRVLFDGIPAPILYASNTQINAAVPYQLFGRAFAQMTVEYNNSPSTALAPRIADTAPGIFTADGRQAAALNADGSFNSPSNPAQAGAIVVLYVTGEGQTAPGGVDGEIVPSNNLKKPLAAVRVRVNGVDVPAADIVYAGSAPALVSGLMQINFKLPLATPANAATPIEVFVGAGQSPAGTTIAVRQ